MGYLDPWSLPRLLHATLAAVADRRLDPVLLGAPAHHSARARIHQVMPPTRLVGTPRSSSARDFNQANEGVGAPDSLGH